MAAGDVYTSHIISIHTLRMEGDLLLCLYQINDEEISIHTLRMEGDVDIKHQRNSFTFQSTPSAWRVTITKGSVVCTINNFNPHPPHGG